MNSIRVKITALTIAMILISTYSVVLVGSVTIQRESDRSSAELMNLIAQNAKDSMEAYLISIAQSVEMVANLAADSLDSVVLAENGVSGSNSSRHERTEEQISSLDAYLAFYCEKLQEIFSSIARHTQGVVTYYYCICPEISEAQHGFFYSRVGKTGFAEREPLDARELDPTDREHTTWYYTTIERGRPSWIGPYTAHFLEEMWTCSYTVPIYKAGTLIGVLGMDIPFETLTDQIDSIHVYESGFACLLGEKGNILDHPDLKMGTVYNGERAEVFSKVSGRSDSGGDLIRYTVGGEERQMAFSTLSNGMKLLVVAPVEEVMAAWTSLSGRILLLTAGIILLSALIVLLIMKVLTRPLKKLTDASQKLADGDYDVELDYEGRDEIGTLTRAFVRMRDHLQQYIKDLNRQIVTDSLTELPNMRYFFRLVLDEQARMEKAGKKPVMLYFNLLGLKFYNRQYGFGTGDRLLRSMARILGDKFGTENSSRFGQDHFAVFTDEEGLEERIQEVFDECAGINEGNTLPVRAGIYLYSIEDVSPSRACDRAKFACDLQKGTYSNGYIYFDKSMLDEANQNRYILSSLDKAISEGWIEVYYQPIVRAASEKVCDEEALSRWIDPEKGFLSPGEFIPVLENGRVIHKLDIYILEQILKKIRAQEERGLYVGAQSLNLSRADFETCDIVEEIRRRVDEAGIPREKITIEITESIVGKDFEFMKQQIRRFKELGFPVWMDDFGSGYSSLDVLKDIHFDLIKLDMRFMENFEESHDSRVILTELIKLAQGLGIETVAEGVETKEQAVFLKETGCTKLQGYYYSKPIPAKEIIEEYVKGSRLAYENPNEAGYYSAISSINLYDLTVLSGNRSEGLDYFYDTLPMAVLESDNESLQVIRCNTSYREFIVHEFGRLEDSRHITYEELFKGDGAPFAKAVKECREEGKQVMVDETISEGDGIHALIRFVASNPVTGTVSCVVVVLEIKKPILKK